MVELAKPPRPPERQLGSDDMPRWMRQVARTAQITPLLKAVIQIIATHDWPGRGQGCTAAVATLAAATPCSRASFQRSVAELCKRGLVQRRPRRGQTSVLTINRKACTELKTGTRLTHEAPAAPTRLTNEAPPASPMRCPPASPMRHKSRTGESRAVKAEQLPLAPTPVLAASAAGALDVTKRSDRVAQVAKAIEPKGKRTVPKLVRLKPPATGEEDAQVRQVKSCWLETCHYEEAHPSPTRHDLTLARLRDGFTVAQLREVILKASKSPWAQGANPDKKRWDDLLHLFKTTETVEQWLAKPTAVDRKAILEETLRHPSLGVRKPGDPPRTVRRM
jgi:hypothetical protein